MKRTTCTLLFAALASISFAQGKLIAHLLPTVNPASLQRQYRIELLDRSPFDNFALFRVFDGYNVDVVQQNLINSGLAYWVEDDDSLEGPEQSQRPIGQGRVGGKIASLYGTEVMGSLNSNLFSQIRYTATPFLANQRRVRVAVLDTGFSPKLGKVRSKFIGNYNAIGTDQSAPDWYEGVDTNQNGSVDDALGHGTFVTGIIVGLAPHAEIVNVKVADADGVATAWSILKGLTYAKALDCELVNLSMGATDQILAMSEILDWCEDNNMLMFAPSGNNDAPDLMFPARISKVISVGSVDAIDQKSSWSNYENRLMFSAPGENIISLFYDGGLAAWSGTSFATPVVTALVADRIRREFRTTPEILRDWLDGRGVNIDPLNPQYSRELGVRADWVRLNQ